MIRAVQALACLAASWVLFDWDEGSFSSFFWIPAAWLAFRRRWMGTILVLLCCPATMLLVMQCRDYANGGWRYVREASTTIQTPQGSLRPDTRVRGFDPGCGTRSSNYWLRHWAEREAIPIMEFLMGPPPGAYTGPYPTLDESLVALRQGDAQKLSDVEDGRVIVRGVVFRVDAEQLRWWGYMVGQADPSPVTAALFRQKCLLVRVPRDLKPRLAAIYAFDVVRGQCFAMYEDRD